CFFLYAHCTLLDLPSFPTRRSSDLKSVLGLLDDLLGQLLIAACLEDFLGELELSGLFDVFFRGIRYQALEERNALDQLGNALHRDRKSTRLNSSHEWISYAVFCLKK